MFENLLHGNTLQVHSHQHCGIFPLVHESNYSTYFRKCLVFFLTWWIPYLLLNINNLHP